MAGNFLIEDIEHLIKSRMDGGNAVLLSAVPGAGKTTFGLHFLEEGFKTDQLGIAILTEISPDRLLSIASSFGFHWKKKVESGLLKIIDCYSFRSMSEVHSKYYVDDPQQLSLVSLKLIEAQKGEKNGRLLLDSASTLLLVSSDGAGVDFLSPTSSMLKRDGFTCLFILEGGAHDAQISNRLRYILDGVLDMKLEEVEGGMRRWFRIYSLRGCSHETRWVSFTIGKKGLTIEK